MTTESFFLKLLWTVVILCVFGFGFENISLAVADYYKYDKITNIERVTPESFTFPAIIVCTQDGGYRRNHYKNGSIVKSDVVFSNLLEKILDPSLTSFTSFKNKSVFELNNHIDTFKISDQQNVDSIDCFRVNAVINKSVELFKAYSIDDYLSIYLDQSYREDISKNEYYDYTFNIPLNAVFFYVYVGDNYLNSFEKLQYLQLPRGSYYDIEINKESIENKLPEPYNQCKESSNDETYHKMNCIKACIYKEIKNKYNCTYEHTLFSILGSKQCQINYNNLEAEFSASCLKECPLESCFSEKFFYYSVSHFSKQRLTNFRFHFRDFSSLNITQIPKTDPSTFLNNIGGGLGLFMGIAFPNLIEFLQFIFEIFSIIFIRKINE